MRTTGLHAAGKGINVAKVLKDLGIDVTVGGFLGKITGWFQQLFSELGIANRFRGAGADAYQRQADGKRW